MSQPLICMIGPVASGKTTAARAVAEATGAELILEDFEHNPLLAEAYRGRCDYRLPSQLWYLLSRVAQLARAADQPGRRFVADYAFCQDWVYAHIWLDGEALELYERLFRQVEPLTRRPDVLVHLDADPAVLLERIAARGRGFEAGVDADLLDRLRAGYRRALADAGRPVVEIDTGATDLRRDEALAAMLGEIDAAWLRSREERRA